MRRAAKRSCHVSSVGMDMDYGLDGPSSTPDNSRFFSSLQLQRSRIQRLTAVENRALTTRHFSNPQNLALISPKTGSSSVGTVSLRTENHGVLSLSLLYSVRSTLRPSLKHRYRGLFLRRYTCTTPSSSVVKKLGATQSIPHMYSSRRV
jgi:hypothetical protein